MHKDLSKIFEFKAFSSSWQHILLKVCICQLFLHQICLLLRDGSGLFKDDGVCHTFHAVFNEELESVSVFVHVEVACINLGYDMLDIECSIKLG
jgi:hypothetical protein